MSFYRNNIQLTGFKSSNELLPDLQTIDHETYTWIHIFEVSSIMKNTRRILLTIGLLGIAASIVSIIQGQNLTNILTGFISGTSLLYGYFELRKKTKEPVKAQCQSN